MPGDDLVATARSRFVRRLASDGAFTSSRVERAFAAAPRDAFVGAFLLPAGRGWAPATHDAVAPDPAALQAVYSDEPLVTRVDAEGRVTSSTSQPSLVASMLETLDVQPGMRVLEVGVGTGWNAALLAELAGPDGAVASVDIQGDVVAEARARLDAAGYPQVAVACRDGAAGWPELAPFDRIVATVGCPDVPPAWFDQLRDDGAVLVPLQHAGAHPLALLRPADGGLAGRVVGSSGFLALQGSLGGTEPWPSRLPSGRGEPDEVAAPLPALTADATFEQWWAAGYTVGLLDRRAISAGNRLALTDGRSVAVASAGALTVWGDAALGEALRAAVSAWERLGRPAPGDWLSTFAVVGEQPPPAVAVRPQDVDRGTVVEVRRARTLQTVRLAPQTPV